MACTVMTLCYGAHMNTTTTIDTNDQPLDFARRINDLHAAGRLVSVGGYTPKAITRRHDVAVAWGNGSVSLRVAAKQAGKTNDVWLKLGQQVELVLRQGA